MIKRMIKAVLTATLVAGLATTAMAETKVGGSIKSYFGLYNDGSKLQDASGDTTKAAPAGYKNANEANLQVTGTHDNVTGFVEFETRTKAGTITTQRWVAANYGAASVKIGTQVVGTTYAMVSGTKSSGVPALANNFVNSGAYAESDGLGIGYKVSDGINLGLTIYSSDVIGGEAGAGTALSANMKFGAIGIMFTSLSTTGMATTTGGYWDTDKKVALGHSAMGIGLKYSISDAMAISLDSVSKSKSTRNTTDGSKVADDKTNLAGMDIQFTMNQLGPGNLVFTYSTDEKKDIGTTAAGKGNKGGNMGIVYDIPTESKKAGLQIVYLTDTSKSNADGAEARSQSYMGAGYYAAF